MYGIPRPPQPHSTAFSALTWWVITDIKQQGTDYLYSVTFTSVSPIMRLILSTVLVLALSSVTLGIFFNTPVSLDFTS